MNMDEKHFLDLVTSTPADSGDLAFFSNIQCALPYLVVASPFQPIGFSARCEQNEASETSKTSDTFFNQTLNTANTIPRILPLIHRDILRMYQEGQNTKATQDTPDPFIVFLVRIGTSLNGFQDTIHGGVLASLLDEALGYCAAALKCCLDATNQHPLAQQTRLYTANVDISYRAPITSPGTVIIKVWFRRKEGRNWFLGAETIGADGCVRTEATALWIREKPQSML